jgi:hypothetical protein
MNFKEFLATALASNTAWWAFSTLARSMPAPEENERWYGWLYRFLQAIAANHDLRK